MTSIILSLVSIAALIKFGVYYWRATIAAISETPLSERVMVAASLSTTSFSSREFRTILDVHDLTPDLRGPSGSFRAIRAYYWAVENLGHLIPSKSDWAQAELSMCTRYMAVLLDQHLERNLACATHLRGI